MAVALTGTGSLFQRTGVLIKLLQHLNGVRGAVGPAPVGATSGSAFWGSPGPAILDLETQANAIFNQFLSTDKDILGTFWPMIANLRTNVGALLPQMGQIVIANLIRMVNDDTGGGYTDPQQALPVLIAQMVTASASVNANNVGSTVTAGSGNTGNGILVCSTTNYDGTTLQNVFPETLTAKVYNTDTAGAERLAVTGPAQVADSLDYLWPGGSGCNRSLTVVTNSDNAGGNLLTNSGFETFTVSNTPDNWELLVSTVGTTLFSDAVNHYRGSKSIKITGTAGAQLTSIAQTFNNASYTLGAVAGDTVYQFSAWVFTSSQPTAGVIAFSLINASNTTINDDAGTANIVSTDLHTVAGATWVNIKGTFRTPATLPSAVKLRIHMTTAIDNGKSVSIDHVSFTPATQLYAGGPFVSVHRGATDLVLNDKYTIAVTNDYEGVFQTWFNRIFDMRNRGFQLPSKANGTETINDTLTQ